MCIEDCRKGADVEAHIDSEPEGENPGAALAFPIPDATVVGVSATSCPVAERNRVSDPVVELVTGSYPQRSRLHCGQVAIHVSSLWVAAAQTRRHSEYGNPAGGMCRMPV